MGQRANLIVVENHSYRLYYGHWCASTLPHDLFWGPEHALRFIRLQQEVDQSGWLDDAWAEGAAVVDRDNQSLLLYGGEELLSDVPLRRLYLQGLAQVWSPWFTQWAHEGIADIADAVGRPRTLVLSAATSRGHASFLPCLGEDVAETIGSIRMAEKDLRLYPLSGHVDDYLLCGPALLEVAAAQPCLAELRIEADEFPRGGFHIDVAGRTLDFWTAWPVAGLPSRIIQTWSGWTARWHWDRFECQSEQTSGRLEFSLPPRETLAERLADMLLQERTSPLETLRQLTQQRQAAGQTIEINPWALHDDRIELPLEERRKILASVLSC